MKHQVTIKRPTSTLDERGQLQGQPTILLKEVWCAIKPINGREIERARALYPEATLQVELHGDPAKRLRPKDYLEFGSRRLEIGHINDEMQNGEDLTLICGEVING